MAALVMERPIDPKPVRIPVPSNDGVPSLLSAIGDEGQELLRVLLVDDTPDDEALALRAMRQSGLPLLVRVARDGEQALRALGLFGDQPIWTPDLIVCDLKMPKISGDDVLAKVRKVPHLAEVPFVVFSSSDESADAERCVHLGADAYVVKPVDFGCYLQTVKSTVLSHLEPILAGANLRRLRRV